MAKDKNGEYFSAGDKVSFEGGSAGVVCDFEDRIFSEGYPEEEWGYLKSGVLLESPDFGLVNLESRDGKVDVELIK